MSDFEQYPNGQPGWYQAEGGQLRWWDGYNWGPYTQPGAVADAQANPSDSKTWAALAQGTHFVTGWIGSLIIRETKGKNDKFVRHHATEALNLSLTFTLIAVVLMIPFMIAIFASVANTSSSHHPRTGRTDSDSFAAGFVITLALFYGVILIIGIYGAIVAIIGIVRAAQGKWYRYPVSIRFVKGAVSAEEAATLPLVGVPQWHG